MRWEIEYGPAYSMLKVMLDPGEEVTAEAGALVMYRGDIEIKTHTGGLVKALLRRALAGESLFLNTFRAHSPAELWFAPPLPGDIMYLELRGDEYVIQDTSYLAHHGDVDLGVAWRGLRGLLAEGELVWFKASGYGGVWVNAYGGIKEIELKPGERMIIDNFHFVALSGETRWRIRKFGGWKSFFFGGEGLVVEVEGPGKVYIQTRILPAFARLLRRFLTD